jgi:hypothetical protein
VGAKKYGYQWTHDFIFKRLLNVFSKNPICPILVNHLSQAHVIRQVFAKSLNLQTGEVSAPPVRKTELKLCHLEAPK